MDPEIQIEEGQTNNDNNSAGAIEGFQMDFMDLDKEKWKRSLKNSPIGLENPHLSGYT